MENQPQNPEFEIILKTFTHTKFRKPIKESNSFDSDKELCLLIEIY